MSPAEGCRDPTQVPYIDNALAWTEHMQSRDEENYKVWGYLFHNFQDDRPWFPQSSILSLRAGWSS